MKKKKIVNSQYRRNAQAFKSQPPFIRMISKPATPSNSLLWHVCER